MLTDDLPLCREDRLHGLEAHPIGQPGCDMGILPVQDARERTEPSTIPVGRFGEVIGVAESNSNDRIAASGACSRTLPLKDVMRYLQSSFRVLTPPSVDRMSSERKGTICGLALRGSA